MVRMADVAAKAGVSMTTVSHVLNRSRPVSDELRRRVLDAVEETGYSPNFVARSLATQRSMVIGLVMPFLTNLSFGPLIAAIEKSAQRHGYTLLVGDSQDDPSKEQSQVRLMLDRQVDGVVLAPVSDQALGALTLLHDREVPAVLIDRYADCGFDAVGVENISSTVQLVGHLAARGHTRIGFVCGRSHLSTSADRLQGYRTGLEKVELPFDRDLVRSGGSRAQIASRAVQKMLRSTKPPTAIIPANDSMTVGVLRGLRDIGARVPEDIAIAAFDDVTMADLITPPLTAMAQPIEKIGETAAKRLLKRISGFAGPPTRELLPPTFHHRASCGCPGTAPE